MMIRNTYEDLPAEEVVYRVKSRDFLESTTAHWSRVQFDPILTPLFTSFFSSIGVTGSIFGTSTAGILGSLTTAIVTTAVTIGIQMMMMPKPPKPEDGKAPLTQAIPNRIWVIGETRLAGAYMLWEAVGRGLYAVQAIAGHLIQSFERFYFHDDEITLQLDGTVDTLPGGRYGGGYGSVYTRLGVNPETAYSEIVAGVAGSLWPATARGDGQASVGMIARAPNIKNFQKIWPYNIPRLSVVVRGAKVWDFRDPAQDPNDTSTWVYSKNPVLQLAWHWCFSEFGHKRDYRKAILPVLDMWQDEADVCDEIVPLFGGGNEKRYECSGWDTTEREPKVGTNAILASFDGWLCERGDGALLVIAGKYRDKYAVTLTDADILGHKIAYDVLFEEEINRLVPKFNYPDTDYSTSDTDFFEDTDRQLKAGRILSEDMNLQWVTSWTQARRLGWREWQRIQQLVRGSLNVRLAGINAVYARWIKLETPVRLPRLNGKLIENRRATLDLMRGGFSMEIVQHPDNIDQWSTSMEGQKPPVPEKITASGVPTPVINSVAAVASSGTVYLRVVIADPGDDSLTPSIRYRVSDIGGGTPGAWVEKVNSDAEVSGGVLTAVTDVVPSDKLLDVQAALISSKGTYSNWTATIQTTSTADPTAPGTPVNLQLSNASGTVSVSARSANDNTRKLVFKRGTTVQSFAAATLLQSYSVVGNQVISFTDTPGAGTWKYWCGSENGSGVPSAAQVSGTITV